MRKRFAIPVDMTQLPRCPTGPHILPSQSFPHVFYSISFSLQDGIKAVQNVNTSGLSMLGAYRRQTPGQEGKWHHTALGLCCSLILTQFSCL